MSERMAVAVLALAIVAVTLFLAASIGRIIAHQPEPAPMCERYFVSDRDDVGRASELTCEERDR